MKTIAALLLILAAGPAGAECLPLADALASLAGRWQEVPVFTGAFDGGAWIVTAAPDGGSFTVLFVRSDGSACPAGAGEGWAAAPLAPAGKEG
ncbi:hypothetical protein [Albidovulum sp.]|uniref:hypothetical protein n=1 Tax=Albidovulum sp. TaxID=1872424 RepID=UPI0039B947C2